MKKVWIGLGIGCGSLILLAILGLFAGGYWVSTKMEGAKQLGQKMQAQNQALQALQAKFPFAAPPGGQPAELREERLAKYLAIRQALLPVAAKLDAKTAALGRKSKQTGLGEALSATGELFRLQQELRDSLIAELGRQEMSPGEFYAYTDAIYPKGPTPKEQRDALHQEIVSLEEQLKVDSLTAEDKQGLEAELKAARERLAELAKAEEGPAVELRAANAKLIEQHRAEIDKQANPHLDDQLGIAAAMGQAFQRSSRRAQPAVQVGK